MTDVVVPSSELTRRTIRRTDWVAENAAFIDCRTPGSDRKSNYAFIGPGVSQNAKQFINLSEPHGYNVGAAGMPNGVNNNLHLHFTAEVFINFGGTFRVRWGVDGKAGEYVSHDGDIISVPAWIFRGFTNEGPDEGLLLTVLGQDVTGGIIWGPVGPQGGRVVRPAPHRRQPADRHRRRRRAAVRRAADQADQAGVHRRADAVQRRGDARSGHCCRRTVGTARAGCCRQAVPGGNGQLALVIGYGMSEDRRQVPRLHEPHSFNMAWLKATPGEGMLRHRHGATSTLIVKSGTWRVTLNEGDAQESVDLGPQDMLSVLPGSWRSIELLEAGDDAAEEGTGELLVVNAGDGRVRLEWAPEVVEAAFDAGWMLDPNGYLAPVAVLVTATEDD